MSELSPSPEKIETELASDDEAYKFMLHFADRRGDDSGSNDHTRAAVAAMISAEQAGDVVTLNDKWTVAHWATMHHAFLNDLVDNVRSGKIELSKADFDKYYDALWRMHEMRTGDA